MAENTARTLLDVEKIVVAGGEDQESPDYSAAAKTRVHQDLLALANHPKCSEAMRRELLNRAALMQ